MATAHESSSEPRVVWGMAQQLDSLFGNEDLLFELDCFVLSFLPDVSFHAEHHSAPDYAAILVVEQQCRMLVREPVTWGDVGVALRVILLRKSPTQSHTEFIERCSGSPFAHDFVEELVRISLAPLLSRGRFRIPDEVSARQIGQIPERAEPA